MFEWLKQPAAWCSILDKLNIFSDIAFWLKILISIQSITLFITVIHLACYLILRRSSVEKTTPGAKALKRKPAGL